MEVSKNIIMTKEDGLFNLIMMMKIKTCVTIGSSSMQTRALVHFFTTLNYWPSNPIPPPEEAATQNNERFVMADKFTGKNAVL